MIDDGIVRVQKSLGNKYIAISSQINRKMALDVSILELKTLLLT